MPGDTAGVRCVLLVVPYLGGGTTRHVREMAAAWSAQGLRVLLLETQGRLVELDLYETGEAVRRLLFPYDEAFLLEMLRGSGVELVHYHHVYTLYPPLMQLPAALGVPYAVTLHDYYTICPEIKLVTPDQRYCGEPDASGCAACLAAWRRERARKGSPLWMQPDTRRTAMPPQSSPEGAPSSQSPAAAPQEDVMAMAEAGDITAWRAYWEKWLEGAGLLLVPHADVQRRLKRYFSALPIEVMENPEVVPLPRWLRQREAGAQAEAEERHVSNDACVARVATDGKRRSPMMRRRGDAAMYAACQETGVLRVRRIGCIGGLSLSKGGGRLLACAREAAQRELPLQFVLFGTLGADVRAADPAPLPANLQVTGPYEEAEVYGQIAAAGIDFFWFPPFWPETYSYTLSIPIRLGLPMLGSDIGAIGARIREHGWGAVYPWDLGTSAMLRELMRFRPADYAPEQFYIANTAFPSAAVLYRRLWGQSLEAAQAGRAAGTTQGETSLQAAQGQAPQAAAQKREAATQTADVWAVLPTQAWQAEAERRLWQELPWHLTGAELRMIFRCGVSRRHLPQMALHTDRTWLLGWLIRHGLSTIEKGVTTCTNRLQHLLPTTGGVIVNPSWSTLPMAA